MIEPLFDFAELREIGLALRAKVRAQTRTLAQMAAITQRGGSSRYWTSDALAAAQADLSRWRALERKAWRLSFEGGGLNAEEIADRLIKDLDASDLEGDAHLARLDEAGR